ncbi:hypothetical protein D3C83_17740 [compost metagenome]
MRNHHDVRLRVHLQVIADIAQRAGRLRSRIVDVIDDLVGGDVCHGIAAAGRSATGQSKQQRDPPYETRSS